MRAFPLESISQATSTIQYVMELHARYQKPIWLTGQHLRVRFSGVCQWKMQNLTLISAVRYESTFACTKPLK